MLIDGSACVTDRGGKKRRSIAVGRVGEMLVKAFRALPFAAIEKSEDRSS